MVKNILEFKASEELRELAKQTLEKEKFQIPYTKRTTSKKGFFLVKDEGVYLMNAFSSDKNIVCYAKGYDPNDSENLEFDLFWEKMQLVSPDDFAEFIPMDIDQLVRVSHNIKQSLSIEFDESSLIVFV
jgi:hypothetical protein